MIKNKVLLILVMCVMCDTILAQQKEDLSKSDMVKLDFKILAANKLKLQAKDIALMPAYDELIRTADKALKFKAVSVMDKTDVPPSGNKHDYMSIGPYWWPDPTKPTGVPYIRKDGEVNPEVKNYSDKDNMPKLCENIYNLSLGYYFSGNEAYAKHAVKLMTNWFLDSATAMNPNLKFGQAVKGRSNGRGEGIIDVRHFIFLLDGATLLKNSPNFNDVQQTKLKKWFTDFSTWLQTSEIGNDEMTAKNNHGVWFDATSLAIANYIGDKPLVNKIIRRATERMDVQMDNKGYFPFELERTTSMHYTAFILDAFTIIAELSENTTTNFWTLTTKSNKSLEKGYDALFPHLSGQKEWTWKQIKPFKISNAYQMLWRAGTHYNCTTCKDIIKQHSKDYDKQLLNLL